MKRITLFCGHYGSGKTNIAVNYAEFLKSKFDKVAIADLDIVNPYFRSKDSKKELSEKGIDLICSEYANTNLDIPALPAEMYAVCDDRSKHFVLDIGGDDRGALVLGRLAKKIIDEGDYECVAVINKYRPLTRDAASTVEVLREVELAGGIKFTHIANCSNLGRETSADTVLSSVPYANEVSEIMGIPVKFTAVEERLLPLLEGKCENLFGLKLQDKII